MASEAILIGVDGGASEVRAHEVVILPRTSLLEAPVFGLGAASASRLYDPARGFRPLPLPSQLLAFERGKVEPAGIERAQGRLWVESAAEVILAVAAQARASRARVGVCMPGIKTPDGRGLAVVRHGPRIPDYAEKLEAALAAGGLGLAQPISRLSSDGEACAHGEQSSAQGNLRSSGSAYYVGGGTGIAEALKIDGAIVGFDALRGFLRKAWQIEAGGGRTVEDLLSPRGMNAAYAQAARKKLPLEVDAFPERRAAQGDAKARAILSRAADALADLVLDRMLALRRGLAGAQPRIPANTVLERVVVGQRLGQILADPAHFEVFRDPAEEALRQKIVATGDGALKKHYVTDAGLRPGLLVASLLRAAPAIGAAAFEVLEPAGAPESARAIAPPPF